MPFRVARHAARIEVGVAVTNRTRIVSVPCPSGPRATGGWCSRLASVWCGRSPAGWQFTQRGFVSTLPSSVNIAADRAPVSDIEAKLSGEASVFETGCEAA
jgi:hypothetical protein